MLDEFQVYLQLGFRHIADLAGYDHMLFIAALAIPYAPRDWRRLAILVTAFTIGHSVTLALATLRLVSVPTRLVEALIPATILITALLSWPGPSTSAAPSAPPVHASRYVLTVGFGLIHGLGFSSYLRSLLGQEENIALPLFAFNVGLELGQLLVLCVVLAVGTVIIAMSLSRRRWEQALVVCTAGIAGGLLAARL